MEEWMSCSFENWYETFSKRTINSEYITLSDDFIDFLNEESIVLPSCVDDINFEKKDEKIRFEKEQEFINKSIKKYGEIFPKLNWSSPRDATWIIFANQVKCKKIEEVLLLLKSSDLIYSDLKQMKDSKIKPVLVLRKYYDLNSDMEFRLFIKNNDLICISQRNCLTFYKHLIEKKDEIENKIKQFFKDEIKNKFELKNYIVDVYISTKNKIWIIDFNVFGEPTEPKLFESWDEIEKLKEFEFRIVKTQTEYHMI
eukprot:gene8499-323_t